MDLNNYNSLRFLGCFMRIVGGDDISIDHVVNRVIEKITFVTGDKYFFKNNFKLIKNSNSNSRVQLGFGYTRDEIYDVIASKICIDEHDRNMMFSVFRSKIKAIKTMLNKHLHEDFFSDNYCDYDVFFVRSNAFDPGEYDNKHQSDDILKNHHDISLEQTRSNFLWKNMFEIIILESLFIEMPYGVWRMMFIDHGRVMVSLRANIELDIFISFCMLKLDASALMFNLMTMIRPYEHMKYNNFFNNDKNKEKINISSNLMLFLCVFYHSNFGDSKHDIKDLFKHLIKFRGHCECAFCHDYVHLFKKKSDFKQIEYMEKIIEFEKTSFTFHYFVSILRKSLYLSRMFYGKNAVKVIESVIIGDEKTVTYEYISKSKMFHGVCFKPIRGVKGINNEFLNFLGNRFEFDIYTKYPLLCVSKWKHIDKCKNVMYDLYVKSCVNTCKIPFLNDIRAFRNFYAYLSQYYNNGLFHVFTYNPIRPWPSHETGSKNEPKLFVFKYLFEEQEFTGMFCENGMLFHTLFSSFNNAMLLYHSNVFVDMPISISKLAFDISNSISIKEDHTQELTILSTFQNRIGIYGLGGILSFKNMCFLDSDFERTSILNCILSRFKKESIWTYLISPYVERNNVILNVNSLEVTHFSEIGINIYSSLQCFLGDYDTVSKAVINFEAIKLIESVLKGYTHYDDNNKTYMTSLYMMPVLKRCISQAYRFYIDNPHRNYIPICIFDDNFIEICKMFFAVCCMDLFTDDDAVFIFLSIRTNEQINSMRHRKMVRKMSFHEKDVSVPCTNMEELISGLIYLSGFSKKFNMNYDHGISMCSFDDIVDLSRQEIVYNDETYTTYGDIQYAGNISCFQKMVECDDIYISPNVANECGIHDQKPVLDGYFFPIPIYIDNENNEEFVSFEGKMDAYCNEEEAPIDVFRKKDFCLFSIPNHIISFLNSIDNCNRAFFEI